MISTQSYVDTAAHLPSLLEREYPASVTDAAGLPPLVGMHQLFGWRLFQGWVYSEGSPHDILHVDLYLSMLHQL
jgi:hypothetical protein